MIKDPMQLSQIKLLHFKKKYQSRFLDVYIDNGYYTLKNYRKKSP